MSTEMYLSYSDFPISKLFVTTSSVGIATRYGLDGPEIESLWEVRFSLPVQTGPEAHPVSYTSVSQPAGRGPVKGPGINYTGPREVLLEFVILVF